MENPNPKVYQITKRREKRRKTAVDQQKEHTGRDKFDDSEIFDLIRNINDPEHPLTLEQLKVTEQRLCKVDDEENKITIYFTPTIPHCSMATLIGLCIRVQLLRSLPKRFKVDIMVTPGSHASEDQVNRQLNDKERVAAALENASLISVVNKCLTIDWDDVEEDAEEEEFTWRGVNNAVISFG